MALDSATLRTYEFEVDPTVNDDVTAGYEVGNRWRNSATSRAFECLDNTEGAAVWHYKPNQLISTFTPAIEFGGASTGITYNAQEGNLLQIGSMIHFSIFISLSNKGSSSGEARIVGLPTANGDGNFAFTFYGHRMDLSLTYLTLGARLAPNEDEIRMFEQGPLLPLQALTDDSFQNNSQLFIAGFYFV